MSWSCVAESTVVGDPAADCSRRHLVARIDEQLGKGVVTAIRVHGPTGPGWRHGPRRVAGRGPRDTYG